MRADFVLPVTIAARSLGLRTSRLRHRLSRRLAGMRDFEKLCNFVSAAVFFFLGHAVYQVWVFCLAKWRNSGGYS
jgi:hypothetical protein